MASGGAAERWLEGRSVPWLVLGITLLVALPSIQIGFYNDDHALRLGLEQAWPGGPRAWDLYRFAEGTAGANAAAIEAGIHPWWTDPGLKLHFVRPLTSLLFAFDNATFGAAPLGYHLHSIAWYLALVAVVGAILRMVLPRATANLAMLVYALSAAHFYPYAWASARHVVLGAVPGVIGLALFLRDRKAGGRAGGWWLALGLAVGLGASEAALGTLAFPVAYLLLGPENARARLRDRLRRGLPAIAPALVVVLAYVVVYPLVGGGAAASGGYVDPLSAPGRYLFKVVTLLPVMMANAFFGMPAELASFLPVLPLAVAGLVAVGVILWLARRCAPSMTPEERASLRWLVAGAVLAVAPSLGGFPGARVLLAPNIGFAALIAVLIRRGLAERAIGVRISAGILLLVHLVLAPATDVGNASYNAGVARTVEAIARGADVDGGARVFAIGASDPMVTLYTSLVMATQSPARFSCWSVLSASRGPHRLTRVSADALVIRPLEGPMLGAPFETLYRSTDRPMAIGDEAKQCGVVYRVAALDDRRPVEVHVQFDVPLDDPAVRLLVWKDSRLQAMPWPAVGESVVVAWAAGPLGVF